MFVFVCRDFNPKKKHAKNNISVGKTEDKDKIAYFLYYNLMSH